MKFLDKIKDKVKLALKELQSLDSNTKKALLIIATFIVLGIVGGALPNNSATDASNIEDNTTKIPATEIKLSPEGEELITILENTINTDSGTCELVQKVIPNTSFDIQSVEIDKALEALSGSYSLTKQFGSEYNLADTPLNQKVTKTQTLEGVEIDIGASEYDIMFNGNTAYISKDCFLSILEHTDSSYETFENGIKQVLSTYSWVKTPLVTKSSISDLEIDLNKARSMLGEVNKEIEYNEVEQSDGTTIQEETGKYKYTTTYKDEYIQSIFKDITEEEIEQKLEVEVRGDNETIITRSVTVPNIMQFVEERKYTKGSPIDTIAIPNESIVYDAMDIEELGDISSNNIKVFSIGENQNKILADKSETYNGDIPISSFPNITLKAQKTEQGEQFKSFFNTVYEQISKVVASYGDFSTAEPKIDNTLGTVYYNLFNNDTNISLHYYSSNSSYQSLTLGVRANKVYFDNKENIESTCVLFEKYTGIKVTADNMQELINLGLSSANGITLIDGDYQLKVLKDTGYNGNDESRILVEAGINVKETEET